MATDIHERLEALAHTLPSAIDTDLDAAGIVRSGTRRRRVRAATVVAGFAVLAMGTLAVTQFYQPPGLQVVADGPESAFQPWQGQEIDVAISLCDDARCPAITPQQQSDLHAQLEADPAVEAVYYESKEKALERFAEQFSDQPELVDSVELDALPAAFRIVLTETATFDAVKERYSEYPGVEEVVDHNRQMTTQTEDVPAGVETVDAEIFMVEVTPDGTRLDLYVEACARQATFVEFEETSTEVRARIVRKPDPDPTAAGCHTSFSAILDKPLNERPVIDLSTGASVPVSELSSP